MLPKIFPDPDKSLYLLSSDEQLLVRDWLDAARISLHKQGFEEIISQQVEAGFDWNDLLQEGQMMSLFASKTCQIIHLRGNKPGQVGAKVLSLWCESPPEDKLLILVTSKVDRAVKNSAWFKNIQKMGEVIELKQIYANQLNGWIEQRAREKFFQLDLQTAAYLAEKTEGNLLAADQELEKLRILYPDQSSIEFKQVQQSISDSARYNQFVLSDACLVGKLKRALKVIASLRAEGYATVQIQYSLQRSIQQLLKLKQQQNSGSLNENSWRSLGIWSNQKSLYLTAMKRLSMTQIERLMQSCATLDRVGKGQQEPAFINRDWQQLKDLVVNFCGKKITA